MHRLWLIALVAEAFHVLPSVAARDLDRDPEQLSLVCLPLLRYAEAKAEFDHSKDDKDLARWKGSSLMDSVKKNKFELARERHRRARDAARETSDQKKRTR